VRFKDFRTFGKFEAEVVSAPGLTLLVGTNGLGKSNFFDALEWGLTGEVRRFKGYMGAADQGKYLTRRGAPVGSHEVTLCFSDGSTLTRGPNEEPSADRVITLLKKAAWSAQIQDISTYLAFTHFLGQAAQQRFTSRERREQWESLKGPSGIDRLDEVRNGLRGRATELAFNRRIRRETEVVAEAARRFAEWQGWRARLGRLREAAVAAGVLSPEEFGRQLDALGAETGKHAPEFRDEAAGSPGERLAVIHAALEATKRRAATQRAMLEVLANLPDRYAAQAAAADPDDPALAEAGQATARDAAALSAATTATATARDQLEAATGEVASLDAELVRLEAARRDLDEAARAEADVARLDAERQRLDAELTHRRAEVRGLEEELTAIQTRAVTLAGLTATAQAASELADLAGRLPDLRAKTNASAAAQVQADSNAAAAREELANLTLERGRLTSDLEVARKAIGAARERASAVAAAVAAIASHLHDDDVDCPVCRTRFERGGLRVLAKEAANAQDTALTAAEARLADLNRQLNTVEQRVVTAEAVLRLAEEARKAAETDAGTVRALERRLAAALPEASGDLVVAAVEAERQASQALNDAQAARIGDEARRAEAAARRDDLRSNLARLEQQLSVVGQQLAAHGAAQRSALERLAAGGYRNAAAEELDVRLADARAKHSQAVAVRLSAEETMRQALEREAAARLRRETADEVLRRLTAAREAAAAGVAALERRWREAGLAGAPEAATLEAALSALAGSLRDVEQLENVRSALVTAYEAAVRDRDLRDLVADMVRVGGKGAADEPERYEAELVTRHEAAKAALEMSESTHRAVSVFADKLRDEAREFSTRFLTPLNGLIDDFNEALLSTPGETVRLNAAYYKDRTQFDMSLHYRDPLDDALYDTDLPPQVVLSEGQLAANGFSILCAASTAYPWSRWRSLLMDDPLQHNDIIHAAAFVDLMRNLVELQSYQLIMSSHDRGEAEFIRRKFEAAGLPCSVIALTAPSRAGVRYLPPDHNGPARNLLAGTLARSA